MEDVRRGKRRKRKKDKMEVEYAVSLASSLLQITM
jgi:hypothetical protein